MRLLRLSYVVLLQFMLRHILYFIQYVLDVIDLILGAPHVLTNVIAGTSAPMF